MKYLVCVALLAAVPAPSAVAEVDLSLMQRIAEAGDESNPVLETHRRRQAALGKKPGGFAEWSRELESAKRKRGRGIRYIAIGTGVMIAVPLVNAAAAADGDGGLGALSLVGLLGGMGLAGYGGYEVVSSGIKIYDLDQEGRIKGYLSLGPTSRGGAQVALSIRF